MIHKAVLMIGLAGMCCLPEWAQDNPGIEVGIQGGAGGYAYIENSHAGVRGVVGVEVCALCGGRFAIFGEYNHFLPPTGNSGYQSAELFGGGLRIQGRGRVRPFFDAGFAAGKSNYAMYSGSPRTYTTAGATLGFGVMIPAGRSFYIRPQLRLSMMSEQYLAASAQVGIGWRF
jgi:hypothetical protein